MLQMRGRIKLLGYFSFSEVLPGVLDRAAIADDSWSLIPLIIIMNVLPFRNFTYKTNTAPHISSINYLLFSCQSLRSKLIFGYFAANEAICAASEDKLKRRS